MWPNTHSSGERGSSSGRVPPAPPEQPALAPESHPVAVVGHVRSPRGWCTLPAGDPPTEEDIIMVKRGFQVLNSGPLARREPVLAAAQKAEALGHDAPRGTGPAVPPRRAR